MAEARRASNTLEMSPSNRARAAALRAGWSVDHGSSMPGAGPVGPRASGATVVDLDSPVLLEWMRGGRVSSNGVAVNEHLALRNSTFFRAANLISGSVGMLPTFLMRRKAAKDGSETIEKAKDHPLYKVLHKRPNSYQTAFEFKSYMQLLALLDGNAYALIIRGVGGRVMQLIPLKRFTVTPKLTDTWQLVFEYQRPSGGMVTLNSADIFHFRHPITRDGLRGLSLIDMALNALGIASQGSAGDGGYMAPIEWDRTIINKLKLVSPIRENARVMSISTAGFSKLFNDRNIGSGWVGETASRPATSTPGIGSLSYQPGELYANPAISQTLLDDAAVDLEAWLANEVQFEFARQEGIAFLSGDGTNKPFGILTYVTGAANAAKHPWGAIATTHSGSAAALTGDGFIDLMYSLPSAFVPNAKLYLNRLSMGAIRKLKDGQGNYLWQPVYVAGQPQTVGGSPVVELPDMPLVAAGNIAALYGDMQAAYLVVDRIGIRILRDPYSDKPYVHFYTTKRVGGGLLDPEPMKALLVAA